MKWGMIGLVAGALAVSLAGCSDQPTSPATVDGELNRLVERTVDLKDRLAAVGRITPEQRVEIALLAHDVTAWQIRTGRSDISVSTSRPVRDDRIAGVPNDGGSDTCKPCPVYRMMFNKICFLVEDGPCGEPGDLIQKVCAYVCFDISGIKPKTPQTNTFTR